MCFTLWSSFYTVRLGLCFGIFVTVIFECNLLSFLYHFFNLAKTWTEQWDNVAIKIVTIEKLPGAGGKRQTDSLFPSDRRTKARQSASSSEAARAALRVTARQRPGHSSFLLAALRFSIFLVDSEVFFKGKELIF